MADLFRHRCSYGPVIEDGAKQRKEGGFVRNVARLLLPSFFVTAIYLNLILTAVAAYFFLTRGLYDCTAWTATIVLLAAALAPLKWLDNEWGHGFMAYLLEVSAEYFPMTVHVEDKEALRKGRPYVLAIEPHSSLPVAWPVVFSHNSPSLPEALRNHTYGVVSSLCLIMPFVRQLYWMVGLRSATRSIVQQLLTAGMAVVVCPGGVQECLYMDHTDETAFLKKRKGFIRLALQGGAPIVPIFAFNQGKTYSWRRPGPPFVPDSWVQAFSRQIGVVPLSIWGRWGSSIPHKTPVNVVVGRPIEVPPPQSDPPPEVVDQYLAKFIQELQALFERHKASYGCGHMKLRVI